MPPLQPMLAKSVKGVPAADSVDGGLSYEPKWDGFRAIVFKNGQSVYLQSRDLRPLDRYFPDLHDALRVRVPKSCVLDGEIVIATQKGLDFDALQLRLHPAASRVAKLAAATPALATALASPWDLELGDSAIYFANAGTNQLGSFDRQAGTVTRLAGSSGEPARRRRLPGHG